MGGIPTPEAARVVASALPKSGRYRKKPVVIEAQVYRAGLEDGFGYRTPEGVAFVWDGLGRLVNPPPDQEWVPLILTREGYMAISPGDYVITGIVGERYPCKPDIFAATYEPADD
jgi:hypothetical protein